MPFVSRKTLFAAAALGIAGAVRAGLYDVAADTPHWRPVHALLDTVRERSIAVRAADLQPPADLASEARIRQGAGNYDAMCAGCHGAPGQGPTELQRGLYPAPPALAREAVAPREAFWVIKHGIKASGMPAWGSSMGDEDIWNLAAFLDALPTLDAAGYAAMVAASEGHSHGGGETPAHAPAGAVEPTGPDTTTHLHPDGKAHEHAAAPPATTAPPAPTTHLHADGKAHEHAPAAAEKPAEPEPGSTHDNHDDHDH